MKNLYFILTFFVIFASCSDNKEPLTEPLFFEDYGNYFYSLSNAEWPYGEKHKYLSIPCLATDIIISDEFQEDELWIEWWPNGSYDDQYADVSLINITFGGCETLIVDGLSGPLSEIHFDCVEYDGDGHKLKGYFKSDTDFRFDIFDSAGIVYCSAKPLKAE